MASRKQVRSAEPIEISIPYNFVPRDYQLPFLRAMDNGCKRAVKVWHRRAGKDKTDLNFTIKRMFSESDGGRIGTYFHLFPTYAQGKKIIWDGIDFDGFRVINHFPAPCVASMNETELQVTLNNGSVYQIIGTDKPDSVVGTNPVGLVFSEFSIQDPSVSDFLDPILAENGGWAVYNFTPRGHNHAKKLYDQARIDPSWFCERLTVDDTKRADGTPVVTQAAIDALRAKGVREDFIQQEFYCSFEGFQHGSIYGPEMLALEKAAHITDVPYDPMWPVFTFWDLGYGNATSIVFVQRIGNRLNIIDYYENSGVGIPHYAKQINNERPYSYVYHYWPHDGRHGSFDTGFVKRDTGEQHNIRPIEIVARGDLDDGIEATRNILPRLYIDKTKCAKLVSALQAYTYEWDEDRQEFKSKPLHNWASNPADAMRTMAMSDFEKVTMGRPTKIHVETTFDPYSTKDYDVQVDSDFNPANVEG